MAPHPEGGHLRRDVARARPRRRAGYGDRHLLPAACRRALALAPSRCRRDLAVPPRRAAAALDRRRRTVTDHLLGSRAAAGRRARRRLAGAPNRPANSHSSVASSCQDSSSPGSSSPRRAGNLAETTWAHSDIFRKAATSPSGWRSPARSALACVRRDRRRQSRRSGSTAGRRSSNPPVATPCASPRHIDWDFGDNRRHGIVPRIPNDFGAPTDIEASSPDAPADLHVDDQGYQTIIKIGDPDTTITGQHRYTLSYTLPEAQLSTRRSSNIDILAGDEFVTRSLRGGGSRLRSRRSARCFAVFNGTTTQCDLEAGRRLLQGDVRSAAGVDRHHRRRRDRRHHRRRRDRPAAAARTPAGPPARAGDRDRGARCARRGRRLRVGAPPRPQRGVRRRRRRRRVRRAATAEPQRFAARRLRHDRSSPTTSSTRWRRSSSCRPRACNRGRGRCCSTRSSTTSTVQLWLSGLAGREAIEIDDNDKQGHDRQRPPPRRARRHRTPRCSTA